MAFFVLHRVVTTSVPQHANKAPTTIHRLKKLYMWKQCRFDPRQMWKQTNKQTSQVSVTASIWPGDTQHNNTVTVLLPQKCFPNLWHKNLCSLLYITGHFHIDLIPNARHSCWRVWRRLFFFFQIVWTERFCFSILADLVWMWSCDGKWLHFIKLWHQTVTKFDKVDLENKEKALCPGGQVVDDILSKL